MLEKYFMPPCFPYPIDYQKEKGKLLSSNTAAAAAAKSLQSCPTLCNPIDGSPPGSPVPGMLQARTLEWVAISFSNAWKWKVKVKSLSRVRLFATPWTAAYQVPPSMGFSRQEYWSGVPLPSPQIWQCAAVIDCHRAGRFQPGCWPWLGALQGQSVPLRAAVWQYFPAFRLKGRLLWSPQPSPLSLMLCCCHLEILQGFSCALGKFYNQSLSKILSNS